MKNRFYFARSLIAACCGIFATYLVVMIIVSISNGRFDQNILTFLIISGLIILFWVSITWGTYISIENNKVYGKVFFIKGFTTSIIDVVTINSRKIFGGLFTEVYMKYTKTDGSTEERNLVQKESLNKEDFKKLIETICTINPDIQIDKDLLK